MAKSIVLTSTLVNTITRKLHSDIQPVHTLHNKRIGDKKREIATAYYEALGDNTKPLLSHVCGGYDSALDEIRIYLKDNKPELFSGIVDEVETDYALQLIIQDTVKECYTSMEESNTKITIETLEKCTREKVAEKYYSKIKRGMNDSRT